MAVLRADEGVRGIDGDDERFAWSDAGAKRLKGVPEPVPVLRVRPRGQTPSISGVRPGSSSP